MLTPLSPLALGSTSLNQSTQATARPIQVAPVTPVEPAGGPETRAQFERQPRPRPEPQFDKSSSGTTFAAAVLSGALAPTPTTLGELYARIGASDIPDNMQMRLKDLQA